MGMEGITKKYYCMTAPVDFVIPNGETGATVDPVVLPAPCEYLGICCGDCGGIDGAATISAQVCPDNQASSPMYSLCAENDPGTPWSEDTPATGSFYFTMTNARRVRRIRFILSVVTTAEVRIKVYGFDGESNINIPS